MVRTFYSRVIISGTAGDAGKTIVSCGLLSSYKSRGINVSGFKKGPDYIDAAWLSLASGKPARNLDSYMMGFQEVKNSFIRNADKNGINLIEGNRGLFDGVNGKGTHSTAELAVALQSPVVIVQDISKVTRTAAAFIAGCKVLGRNLNIAGVILNRAANKRHAWITQNAIEGETGIPVLGVIPKLSDKFILPERKLGLITPAEFEQKYSLLEDLKNIVDDNVDVSKIMNIAVNAPPIQYDPDTNETNPDRISVHSDSGEPADRSEIKIGYLKDKAFSFYYPENFELLIKAGAELIPICSSNINELDNIDALYIGGGFPELNLEVLSSDKNMKEKIKKLADEGLPVFAECGGLIYLAKTVLMKEKEYQLSGVLPIVIRMYDKPQGHGYCEAVVDKENPFFEIGTVIKGHEFHYSKIFTHDPELKSSLAVSRGAGCFDKRDGLTYKNVYAGYIHMHALATPEWIGGMIKSARGYKEFKNSNLVRID